MPKKPPPAPDSALALRSSLLRTMLWYMLVLSVLWGLNGLIFLQNPESESFFFATRGPMLFVCLASTSVAAYITLQFGSVTTAAVVFLVAQGIALTLLAVTAGGAGSVAFSGYLCLVLMGGLLFGLWGGLLSSALCLAAMAGLLYAGEHSMLPPVRGHRPPVSLFNTYLFYMGWVSLLVFQYARTMDSARYRLGERIKELTGLHAATQVLQHVVEPLETMQALVDLIPPAYQFPEHTEARLKMGRLQTTTPGFVESPFLQKAEFVAPNGIRGSIEVIYRPDLPTKYHKEPFLPEERALLDTLAEMLLSALERRTAHTALRESESRLSNLFDSVRDGIYQLSPERTFVSLNPAFETITGWSREDWSGKRFDDLIHPDDLPRAAENFFKAMQGDQSPPLELRIRKKSGEYVSVELLGVPQVKDGNVVGILGTARDITERKRLEAQIQRTQRLDSIGTLAGGIAHDLNNVLTPILLSVGLLERRLEDERARQMLASITAAAQRGSAIVKQVLTFARGSGGDTCPLQLRNLAGEMEAFMRETFPRHLEIRFDTQRDLPLVLGDATQIHQVLLNLCVNARDAMPKSGVLTVTTRVEMLGREDATKMPHAKPGSYAVLTVTDTGSGIPSEIQAKIFDPFFTTKAEGTGTGLGLSMTLSLVRAHGGFIHLVSDPVSGTEFHVYFPVVAGRAELEAAEKAVVPMGNGEVILVVDDEQASLYFIREILEAGGYSVRLARDGAEGFVVFSAAETGSIRLIVTDIDMPRMNGLELAERVHTLAPSQRILVTSGSSSPDRIAKTAAFGPFLPKPYTPDELLIAVGKAMCG